MSLIPGARLGSYEVTAKLGEGGMGEVYRARDTSLNRDVAIKVLPEAFALDADRLARFTREAQVLASLNHPNIAAIYGLEKTSGGDVFSHALIMELVEGQDLSELIGGQDPLSSNANGAPPPFARPARAPHRASAGPQAPPVRAIPLSDALQIARQIIDALEAAHEQGIVHRDLKPQNIKVRADGMVKVLDFGLAKAMDSGDGVSGATNAANSPTLTARATQMGMIIGTAAYMAPEQARGRPVDRRADIWAFGVVLYEMLTGRRAFDGEDVSVTLANVIKETPTWEALPADLPSPLQRLLRRCLEKDPKRRLSSIGDARFELDEALNAPETAPPAVARGDVGRRERAIWAAVATVATVAAAWFAWPSSSRLEAALPMARFEVAPPGEGRFTGLVARPAISPDGRALVFPATSKPLEAEKLWIRRLDSMEVTPLPGTEATPDAAAPQSPFWSPDNRQIAFFVETGIQSGGLSRSSRLRVVDAAGGAVRTICELPSNVAAGGWNAEGVMVVSSLGTKGVQRVSANGGVPTQVTTLDAANNEVAHVFPQFLPDGRHFIYTAQTARRDDWAIFVGALDSAVRQKVVKSDYARFAAPNLLLYVSGENTLAQTMDMKTWQLTGDPVVVATGVDTMPSNGRAGLTISDTGVLVYSSAPNQQVGMANRRLTWTDRQGRPLGAVGAPVSATTFRLAPDGNRVALVEIMGDLTSRQLWVADVGRNVKAPLTSTRRILSPVWSEDSTRLLFASPDENGRLTIAERLANGATPMTTVHREAGQDVVPLDESNDGTLVVFSQSNGVSRGLYVLSRPDGKVVPYLLDGFDHPQATLSADGRWLAYSSNESGDYQIIVQPFPDPSRGKWPISAGPGTSPRWRRDGRELFYVDGAMQLTTVSVNTTQGFVPGAPQPLFSLRLGPALGSVGAYGYEVSPDGQRILLSVPPGGLESTAASTPLKVLTNWTQVMKK